MRCDMTFDDTLRDGSSFGKFPLLLVLFKLKAGLIFRKKIVELHLLKVSWVS